MKITGCLLEAAREWPIRPVEEEREGEAEEQECEEDDEVETGKRMPARMADPQLPTEEEVQMHQLTHLPYRSWCCQCIRGRGKALEHRRQNREHQVPEVHLDYCFMGTAKDRKTKCILVAKEANTRYVLSTAVPMDGGEP